MKCRRPAQRVRPVPVKAAQAVTRALVARLVWAVVVVPVEAVAR